MTILRTALLTLLLLVTAGVLHVPAQEAPGTVRVRVESEGEPLDRVQLSADGVGGLTDAAGRATLRLPPGLHRIVAQRIGYATADATVEVRSGEESSIVIGLEEEAVLEEEIIVLSTRTGRRIEDEPVRVEVLAAEEIEEKIMMLPGDISMMLNETSGLRVQNTSPSLGGANVRIQGLRGRYTQLLSDGLPLYGGQSGALSMLQIPPMDLAQVEVIKGVASALYGGSALGGVINLISRRPDDETEILLNQTSRGGSDAILWSSGALSERTGYTFIGSGHRQGVHDVDDDGWADLPGFERLVLRPRLVWDDGAGRSLFVTAGTTVEDRRGGTTDGGSTPAGAAHREALETRRGDVGLFGRALLGENRLLTARASVMGQRHDHTFGIRVERDLHTTAFGEVALSGSDRGHTWVVGGAMQREAYDSEDVPRFDFTHTTGSVFVQDEVSFFDVATVAASGRLDVHGEYGAVFNPRVSLLLRPGAGWTARASAGTGYYAPTPFTEETEVLGLTPVEPLGELEIERARSASLDLGRAFGPFELNATLFGSEIRDALLVRSTGNGTVELFNATEPTRTWGTDLLARFEREPIHLIATYTHTRSTEEDPETGARVEAPLTPRHAAGLVGMLEAEDRGRVGLEVYYVGRQRLEENPYRDHGRAHWIVGLLVERRFGPVRAFLNAENVLDTRQTRYDPLVRPERTPAGRWTTDAWAPLDGRTFNAGARIEL